MNDSFDCHGVCMNEYEIPANLIFPITYIEHFLHLNWLFLTADTEKMMHMLFSRVLVNFLIAVLRVSACIF